MPLTPDPTNAEHAVPLTDSGDAHDGPCRKVWSTPRVIMSKPISNTAKTTTSGFEGHTLGSLSFS